MIVGQLPPYDVLASVRGTGRGLVMPCPKLGYALYVQYTIAALGFCTSKNSTGRVCLCALLPLARLIQGGGSTRNESECEMIEDVHEAVADLVDIIKVYQSKSKISQVLMSKMFKRRQEEAEAVVDRVIWRLNVSPPMVYAFF